MAISSYGDNSGRVISLAELKQYHGHHNLSSIRTSSSFETGVKITVLSISPSSSLYSSSSSDWSSDDSSSNSEKNHKKKAKKVNQTAHSSFSSSNTSKSSKSHVSKKKKKVKPIKNQPKSKSDDTSIETHSHTSSNTNAQQKNSSSCTSCIKNFCENLSQKQKLASLVAVSITVMGLIGSIIAGASGNGAGAANIISSVGSGLPSLIHV
ncbi:hypothetical protein CLAVI_000228 [Candidatus Clavichlamydia salmonicola]|uniref:hypothetical protein n=1 Tax=Candidatus Clavichlamydia salmonicola TaxID=469812 RepID=UPI0018916BB7|nr:hypothetical protein [Candidatus Clavichlamydia salmonicola]MBF5050615.1 hypothetical protein [Candidatus Clavichlamydia salmonicola]